MPGGLVALLDDIAAIAKMAAASVDDVASAASQASIKSAGVVIDDTAVTPSYVLGLSPDRELPIIAKIALGSVRNKLLILLPAALLLSYFAPWAITPILMMGGAYLCFEGAEKIMGALTGADHGGVAAAITDPRELEKRQVSGAIRTDLILSAEIMAIALAGLPPMAIAMQAAVLAVVGLALTIGVYGVVAIIVKMDDIGLNLARRRPPTVRAIGRGLVKAMPIVLEALATIGTAAMLWVGGGIIVHGLEVFQLETIPHAVHGTARTAAAAMPMMAGLVEWLVGAIGSAIIGLALGGAIAAVLHFLPSKAGKSTH
ncbi:DUF808 domain-containing protein [Sphingomonas sp. 28-63-12]|uniref:DUF808 domain-containing protein n=1 Tax=Sphingomonas sp. 28-63-12 TaxID=1970434 RepID=UPI000BDBC85B|nr:MAG: ABC transporter [Sphingomonas sp. 28-63-12]